MASVVPSGVTQCLKRLVELVLYFTQLEGTFSSIGCYSAFEEARGANSISLMASVVPSEACGAHPTFILSSNVLLGVALRLKRFVELIMYL